MPEKKKWPPNFFMFLMGFVFLVAMDYCWYISQYAIHTGVYPSLTQTTSPAPSASSSTTLYVPYDQFPQGMPNDLPIESNAVVLENYQTNDSTQTEQQSVRRYETTKTLTLAFADYTNYFQKNGWTVDDVATVNRDITKSLTAMKDLATLQVLFNTNTVSNKNTVTITASYSVVPLDANKTYPTVKRIFNAK